MTRRTTFRTTVTIRIGAHDTRVDTENGGPWDNAAVFKAGHLQECLTLGLPHLVERYGESSGEAEHVRETIAALEKL